MQTTNNSTTKCPGATRTKHSDKLPQLPEFTISFKTKTKPSELHTITCSEDIAKVCRVCFDLDSIDWVESFIAIALNRGNKVIGFYKLSQGGISGTVADPRVVMQFALLSNATSLIICHNHPSGNTKPSGVDEQLTLKLKTALQYFEIKLLDHIILTSDSYSSFADEGLL